MIKSKTYRGGLFAPVLGGLFTPDKGGQFADFEAWKTYVDQFAQGLLSPIEVSVSVR